MAKLKAVLPKLPHDPAPIDLLAGSAIKQLAYGEASSDQQKVALKWIIEAASGMYEPHYYQSERDTVFALGKAFVGQQIVGILNADLTPLRREDEI